MYVFTGKQGWKLYYNEVIQSFIEYQAQIDGYISSNYCKTTTKGSPKNKPDSELLNGTNWSSTIRKRLLLKAAKLSKGLPSDITFVDTYVSWIQQKDSFSDSTFTLSAIELAHISSLIFLGPLGRDELGKGQEGGWWKVGWEGMKNHAYS